MIPTNRQQVYQDMVTNTAQSPYYAPIAEIFPYLEDINASVPTLSAECIEMAYSYLATFLGKPSELGVYDEHILDLMRYFWANKPQNLLYDGKKFTSDDLWGDWAATQLHENKDILSFQKVMALLKKEGVTDYNIWLDAINNTYQLFYIKDETFSETTVAVKTKYNPKEIATFLANEVSPMGLWVLEKTDEFIQKKPVALRYQTNQPYQDLLILAGKIEVLNTYFDCFCMISSSSWNGLSVENMELVEKLLVQGVSGMEEKLLKFHQKATNSSQIITLQRYLLTYFPEEYKGKELEFAYHYLNIIKPLQYHFFDNYDSINGDSKEAEPYYNVYINSLIKLTFDKEGFEKAFPFWKEYLNTIQFSHPFIYKYLVDCLGEKALPILIDGLNRTADFNLYGDIFQLLATLPHEDFHADLWKLAGHKSKEVRTLVTRHFATVLGDAAIPKATELLGDKKAEARLTGALLLSMIRSGNALEVLNQALETEKNDDNRDAILEGLTGLIPADLPKEKILQKVEYAAQRAKLTQPIEKWLDETTLPPIRWKDTGEVIDIQVVRFLLYRMSRVKDIRFDVEAKPLFAWIDKETSANFANALLKSYLKNSADAKGKYILTIASVFGDNETIDLLKRQVVEWTENARGKMGEYATKAIALQGSNKALRVVEFFTRKFKNKNKNIGEAANQAFVIAAEELGITPFDLADSIIPDFGFVGLFREFEVEGEKLRAYIDNNFKLAYLSEDNRAVKALPKATSTELKEEFKEIGKEIRDIVKSQSSRLEQYLIMQRRWEMARWEAFFMQNPVIFAYAIRLIWGIYDEKGTLKTVFRVQEDQSFLNREGNEFELKTDDTNLKIGMVHPTSLSSDDIAFWQQSQADAGVEAIFPQLARPMLAFDEKHRGVTLCNDFENIKINGYTFIGRLEKTGWCRGSIQDAGWIASYYKSFSDLGITVILEQQGSLSVGYYDDSAELGGLSFVKEASGNNYYPPSDANDSRLIALENIPPIIYSEIMAEMAWWKENTEM